VCLFVCYFYFCSVFVLCLVFPLLSVSLDCLSHCCQCLWIVCPIVVSVSGLSIPLLSVSLKCLFMIMPFETMCYTNKDNTCITTFHMAKD
jgi:hypothetical protein